MVQQLGIRNPELAADAAEAQIARAEHQPLHPRRHQRAGAHRTRLQGRVDRGPLQPVISQGSRRRAQRQDLSVRRRIV